jgi:hypothetical protein
MRKRFTRDEKAAFLTPGTDVEWRNGSHWHPGTIMNLGLRVSDGWQCIPLINHADTRTVSPGQRIDAGPTFIRLPRKEGGG